MARIKALYFNETRQGCANALACVNVGVGKQGPDLGINLDKKSKSHLRRKATLTHSRTITRILGLGCKNRSLEVTQCSKGGGKHWLMGSTVVTRLGRFTLGTPPPDWGAASASAAAADDVMAKMQDHAFLHNANTQNSTTPPC